MPQRRTTTKDIALLRQLFDDGQLNLAPEFQRNSVWPRPAKAYLLDTVLADRPVPPIFLQRHTSAQTGRPSYTVIDGQQRLRAIFEFLDNRFALTQSDDKRWQQKRFRDLLNDQQEQILNYDLVIEELSGYSEKDIRDLFVRINKYVVRLSPQELRHAHEEGAFADFVEGLGQLDFWRQYKVFTAQQMARMRHVEFAAELAILLIEGPQDKKRAVDLYYGAFRDDFKYGREVAKRLDVFLQWVVSALPDLASRRFRKPVDLYALIGALDRRADEKTARVGIPAGRAGDALRNFERQLKRKRPVGEANRYLLAASRQTDNLQPRQARIAILGDILDAA